MKGRITAPVNAANSDRMPLSAAHRTTIEAERSALDRIRPWQRWIGRNGAIGSERSDFDHKGAWAMGIVHGRPADQPFVRTPRSAEKTGEER